MQIDSKIKQPVFLCGMMGSGKSSVGPRLAEMMNVSFNDLDSLIEEQEAMTIPGIFASKGEAYFRQTEQKVLLRHLEKPGGVLALGGGSLQNQHIADHIKLAGWLVFLDVPVETLVNRLSSDTGRPMISMKGGISLQQRIQQLLDQRRPLYSQAHITIKTGTLQPDEIARNILNKLTIYES